MIQGIHHYSVIVADAARATAFYTEVLGLAVEPARPELGFPGTWLKLPGGQQIHLMELPNPDSTENRPAHGGRDRHVALVVSDLEAVRARLAAHGVDYTLSQSGRKAMFCRDPDANAIEFIQL